MTRHEFLRLATGGSLGALAMPLASPRDIEAGTAQTAQAPAKTYPTGITSAIVDFITKASFGRIPGEAERARQVRSLNTGVARATVVRRLARGR